MILPESLQDPQHDILPAPVGAFLPNPDFLLHNSLNRSLIGPVNSLLLRTAVAAQKVLGRSGLRLGVRHEVALFGKTAVDGAGDPGCHRAAHRSRADRATAV